LRLRRGQLVEGGVLNRLERRVLLAQDRIVLEHLDLTRILLREFLRVCVGHLGEFHGPARGQQSLCGFHE
jgi:hypothetical protein